MKTGFKKNLAFFWLFISVLSLIHAGWDTAVLALEGRNPAPLEIAYSAAAAIGIIHISMLVFLFPPLAILSLALAKPACEYIMSVPRFVKRELFPTENIEREKVAVRIWTFLISSLTSAAAAYLMIYKIFLTIRTAEFAAILSVLASALSAVLFLISFKTFGFLWQMVAKKILKVKATWYLFSPATALVLIAAFAGAVSLRLNEKFPDLFMTLRFSLYLIPATSAAIAAFACSMALNAFKTGRLLLFSAFFSTLSFAFLLFTAFFSGDNNVVRQNFSSNMDFTEISYSAVKKILDFDGDGVMSLFGENDCEPFDRSVYGGAPEIPNNFLDEDCNGSDLTFSSRIEKPAYSFPIPPQHIKKYNIILITIDAISPNRLPMYGYKRLTAPFLKHFSEKSLFFPLAFSQGPSTRLSFPSIFTSRYDSQISTTKETKIPTELLPDNLFLAEILKREGYRTAAVLPIAYFSDWRGLLAGFDEIVKDPIKYHKAPVFHNANEVTETAKKVLKKNDGRPLFLWVHYYDPHSPFTLPPNVKPFGSGIQDIYDTEILYTDNAIGDFVGTARTELNQDDTIIIISGDHGEAFDTKHKQLHHGFDLHTNVLHVPLMIKAPFAKPAKVEMPVSLMDIVPTIVNILNIKGEFDFEGRSLVSQMFDPEKIEDRLIFHQFYLPEYVAQKKKPLQMISVRNHTFNFIHNLSNNTFQLYDYRRDPNEIENLYEKMPELSRMFAEKLSLWLAEITK